MTRSELEKHLGRKVEVLTFNHGVEKGVLHKTNEEEYKNNFEISMKNNYYFCESENNRHVLFRCSHVKKIRRIE